MFIEQILQVRHDVASLISVVCAAEYETVHLQEAVCTELSL